jgi:hypothetical protein
MADPATWFDGDAPRSAAEARFLAALRAHDDAWTAAGLAPSGTGVLAVLMPLHVQVDLPGLPPRHVNLQVGFWASGPRGTGVEGGWGDHHLLDGDAAGSLAVFGLPAEAEELAGLTARWLVAALAEPVDRADWLDADGAVLASRWRLARSGAVVGARGARPRLRRRRAPDRVERVR